MKVAVIGGDAREHEVVRLMLQAGIEVKAIGLPRGIEEIIGKPQEATVKDAVTGVDAIVCPIPGMGVDESIFSPSWPHKLFLTEEDLSMAAQNAVVIMGTASATLRRAIEAQGLRLREYEQNDELMILRSAAIAEGAIKIAIENTDFTIHRSPVAVLGFGRVSQTLIRTLDALKAKVTLFARNPVQIARAWEMGVQVRHLDSLKENIPEFKIIINTIPVPYLNREVISLTATDVLLMDLSAPPGGIDFDAAKELGRKAIWARGLGSRAPKTVGMSQWKGISQFLREELGWQLADDFSQLMS